MHDSPPTSSRVVLAVIVSKYVVSTSKRRRPKVENWNISFELNKIHTSQITHNKEPEFGFFKLSLSSAESSAPENFTF